MDEIKTTKYQLFELPVPATATAGQRIYIGDQPQLRSQSGQAVYIQSIETFTTNALTKSPFSALTTALNADLINAILVLNVGGYEDLQGVPLVLLNRVQSAGVSFCQDLFGISDLYKVDWTKSYIQLNAAPSGAIAYLFGVRYKTVLGNISL